MLTQRLLALANLGAGWVLWLLLFLSVASVAIMIERGIFFAARRLPNVDAVAAHLLAGDLAKARSAVEGREGMEADVVRAAVDQAPRGADAVLEVVNAQLDRSRLEYERRLAFLGTLGNNAPFVGLFGTVLGIIRAFADLAAHPGAAGAGAVMAGISEALVATAVGLFVALPAVVMFNLYLRWLRRAAQRSSVLGHAVVAYLKARPAAEG
ncbi:MAG TPA: MotA/TolQ/ExbB proton channel family protein [Anaeromyxobacteraceae bacterium]|nr:MotA/TolQ/ExbB proton channel family protein [Anaeromyxobacteraceae bacterium]